MIIMEKNTQTSTNQLAGYKLLPHLFEEKKTKINLKEPADLCIEIESVCEPNRLENSTILVKHTINKDMTYPSS